MRISSVKPFRVVETPLNRAPLTRHNAKHPPKSGQNRATPMFVEHAVAGEFGTSDALTNQGLFSQIPLGGQADGRPHHGDIAWNSASSESPYGCQTMNESKPVKAAPTSVVMLSPALSNNGFDLSGNANV